VKDALKIDPNNLDGLQTLATLRLSQNRRVEACQTIDEVNTRIIQIRDVVRARTVVDEISGVEEPQEFQGIGQILLQKWDFTCFYLKRIQNLNFALPLRKF
jgi:hypothetical protein